METNIVSEITLSALRIREIDKKIVKCIAEVESKDINSYLQEFMDLKKSISKQLIKFPVVKIENSKASIIIEKVRNNDDFVADKILNHQKSNGKFSLDFAWYFTEDEIEQLGSELFYKWFSHFEYLQGLFSVGALVLNCAIPSHLKKYVEEVRNCFAFQQYNAVYGLCRTIIEIAVRENFQRKYPEIYKKINKENIPFWLMSDILTEGNLKGKLKKIYSNSSKLLHGKKSVKGEIAKQTLQNTFDVVSELYKL